MNKPHSHIYGAKINKWIAGTLKLPTYLRPWSPHGAYAGGKISTCCLVAAEYWNGSAVATDQLSQCYRPALTMLQTCYHNVTDQISQCYRPAITMLASVSTLSCFHGPRWNSFSCRRISYVLTCRPLPSCQLVTFTISDNINLALPALHLALTQSAPQQQPHARTLTSILRPFFRDYPGEPVPEEISFFWTLWCKGI